ncbi:Mur ligase [Setomelanomma holmii]|uniref:Mur ligase n=1 Tax=Setomelanomma holmii TaxID=210430 RepID=A0A9P4HIZ8_9PLEO|nr:Mur ligase [Setomelanomma holmii]
MIQPGLERIGLLLKNVQFPWKSIHVAGTNGKGSICHHAAALLKRRTVRVGKFTSPHLIDRWDCISINNQVISERQFRSVEDRYIRTSKEENINASPFEILTATAFTIFNEAKVDVGVVEVGMGGLLDATNILNNQAISVISKIARDHEGFLGNTLEEIAKHKAGILRPNVPYIVNPVNEWQVHDVIDEYAKEIGAGPRLHGDTHELRQAIYSTHKWRDFAEPLRPFQRDNAVLAMVAVQQTLKSMGMNFKPESMLAEISTKRANANPGRFQYAEVEPVFGHVDHPGRKVLVDGAHNPDAAVALVEYVDHNQRRTRRTRDRPSQKDLPVTWVLAMTEGKDAKTYLSTVLKSGDNVVTTSFGSVDGMPWVKPMNPKDLATTAKRSVSGITALAMPQAGVMRALCAAKYLAGDQPITLTGSLYLVGDFYRELRDAGGSLSPPKAASGCLPSGKCANSDGLFWNNKNFEADWARFKKMHEQEQDRVNRFLSGLDTHTVEVDDEAESPPQRKRRIQAEIEALDREIEALENEEQQLSPQPGASQKKGSTSPPLSLDSKSDMDFNEIREALEAGQKDKADKYLRIRRQNLAAEMESQATDEDETLDLPMRGSDKDIESNNRRPRIRMHFAAGKGGEDRRAMFRPDFVYKSRSES